MHINPACPRLSSPDIPTTKFNDIASKIFIEIGIKSPVNLFDAAPVTTSTCAMKKPIMTIAYVINLSRVAYFNFKDISAYLRLSH